MIHARRLHSRRSNVENITHPLGSAATARPGDATKRLFHLRRDVKCSKVSVPKVRYVAYYSFNENNIVRIIVLFVHGYRLNVLEWVKKSRQIYERRTNNVIIVAGQIDSPRGRPFVVPNFRFFGRDNGRRFVKLGQGFDGNVRDGHLLGNTKPTSPTVAKGGGK